MKHLISALLALTIFVSVLSPASAFSDVDDPAVSAAVSVLSGMGIVSGYADGGYHPDDALTRAQFCKLAILMENKGNLTTPTRALFSDLSATHWAASFVSLAYTEGLVSGYGDGTFGPDDPITTGQAVTVLLHLLGYRNEDIGAFWPEDYMTKAAQLGLLDGVTAEADAPLTRGEAALLLRGVLEQDTVAGQSFLSGWSPSSVEHALIIGRDEEAPDGRLHTAKVYANGAITYYDQAIPLPGDFVGNCRGTLLLDKSGKTTGFVPDGNTYQSVFLASVEADSITDSSGKTYSIPSTATVLVDDEVLKYSGCWYEMDGRYAADLCYNDSGSIDLVAFSGQEAYDGVLLTGYYENATPNAAAPSQITLLGLTLDVADAGKASLTALSVGSKITVVLNGAGEVAGAYPATEKKTELVGVLTAGSASALQVTLTSGLVVSGAPYTTSGISDLVGTLVKVSSTGVGTLSVSALTGSAASGKLDVTTRTLGKLSLSADVKLYDRVGTSAATEVAWDDLLVDFVPAASIGYVGLDASGTVNLLVLEDITGSCYTYGFLQAGTQSGGSGTMAYTNNTVAVEHSGGTSPAYLIGASVKNGAAAGVAAGADGKAAGVVYLTKAQNVSRSGFQGTDTVLAGGYLLPISDAVEVYNSQTKGWTTLAAAKAFTGTFTVYYDKTPQTGGQVRLIVAEA